MKTCYISGKISGLKEDEYTRNFDFAKSIVSLAGFKPISPLDLPHPFENWYTRMILCLFVLTFCECVYFMDDWRESRGARIEYKWAKIFRKNILIC